MKHAITLITLAGLISAASGQTFTLSIVPESDLFDGSTTQTLGVYGDADIGTHMLGGGFGLSTNSSMLISNISWTPATWSSFNSDDFGYDGNGNYGQIIFGQLVIPGVPPFDVPAAGSEIGSAIGFFEIELTEPLNLLSRLDFNLVTFSPFTLEVIDINAGTAFQDTDGTLVLNGLSIPTPSTLALLGFGGLAARRRRR